MAAGVLGYYDAALRAAGLGRRGRRAAGICWRRSGCGRCRWQRAALRLGRGRPRLRRRAVRHCARAAASETDAADPRHAGGGHGARGRAAAGGAARDAGGGAAGRRRRTAARGVVRIRLRARRPRRPGHRRHACACARCCVRPAPPAYPGGWDLQRDAFYAGLGGSGFALGPAERCRRGSPTRTAAPGAAAARDHRRPRRRRRSRAPPARSP